MLLQEKSGMMFAFRIECSWWNSFWINAELTLHVTCFIFLHGTIQFQDHTVRYKKGENRPRLMKDTATSLRQHAWHHSWIEVSINENKNRMDNLLSQSVISKRTPLAAGSTAATAIAATICYPGLLVPHVAAADGIGLGGDWESGISYGDPDSSMYNHIHVLDHSHSVVLSLANPRIWPLFIKSQWRASLDLVSRTDLPNPSGTPAKIEYWALKGSNPPMNLRLTMNI